MNIRRLKNFITDLIQENIPPDMTYHGLHHTIEVLDNCNSYIRRMNIKPEDAYLLRTAALLHDVCIMWDYSAHEDASIKYAEKILPDYGYTNKQIKIIGELIAATCIPQKPKTTLEKIICDADLDYLGTDSFYSVGKTLFHEFLAYKVVKNKKEWDELQIKFLTNHSYHTKFARKNRAPVKQKYLLELKKKYGRD